MAMCLVYACMSSFLLYLTVLIDLLLFACVTFFPLVAYTKKYVIICSQLFK